jgi:AcrR family transcriptional regulator
VSEAEPRRGARTRKRILDEAERIFSELDYSAARLEDVAQAVGIRRASIVYYFPGKQELYDAVEARAYSSMIDTMRSRLASSDSTWNVSSPFSMPPSIFWSPARHWHG